MSIKKFDILNQMGKNLTTPHNRSELIEHIKQGSSNLGWNSWKSWGKAKKTITHNLQDNAAQNQQPQQPTLNK